MGGRRVLTRLRLKKYIELNLENTENLIQRNFPDGFVDDYNQFDNMTKLKYYQGKRDALKWVLNRE